MFEDVFNGIDLEAKLPSRRLVLRPLRSEYADELFPILDDSRLHEYTGGSPLSLVELRARYATWERRTSPDGHELWLNWIARRSDDGEAVGHLQATVSGTRATLAWVIGSRWQGNGYASEAAGVIVQWLFEKVGVAEVVAHIHPEHVASERVAVRLGLATTGELAEGERVWRLQNPEL